MGYFLFLDDDRDPFTADCWDYLNRHCSRGHMIAVRKAEKNSELVWAKSNEEAMAIVSERGLPYMMSLDHDLGQGSVGVKIPESKTFVKWLFHEYVPVGGSPPKYQVHSSNECGSV